MFYATVNVFRENTEELKHTKRIKFSSQNEVIRYKLSLLLNYIDNYNIFSILVTQLLLIINNDSIQANIATNIYKIIGDKLFRMYFYNVYSDEAKIKNKKSDIRFSEWKENYINNNEFLQDCNDNTVITLLGATVSEWSITINLLKLKTYNNDEGNNTYCFMPSDIITNILNKNDNKKKIPLIYPEKLPMIDKPKKYIRETYKDSEGNIKYRDLLGGYFLNDTFYNESIFIENWRLRNKPLIADTNIVYNTVNNISSVGYKINKDVLNFIRLNDEKFDFTLINKTHELENKLLNNNKLTLREIKELESFKSKKYLEENVLAIAETFENVEEFYIPVRLDYFF